MKENIEMQEILICVQSDRNVKRMKNYIQHGCVSTYEHCENVAKLCYDIDKIFSLHADLKVLLTGAMLHDFYLYDWHSKDCGEHRLHGLRHAETACKNARKYLDVDDKTMDVISCHMWPLNPRRIPSSKEAWIVCMADKLVSLYETFFRR